MTMVIARFSVDVTAVGIDAAAVRERRRRSHYRSDEQHARA